MYSKYFLVTGFALSGGFTYNILDNYYNSKNRNYNFMQEKYNIFNNGFLIGFGIGASIVFFNSKLLKSS